ncbi:hypothetical protein [Pantoea sp. 1.19]|uniref:hypothetical protein n=1 Tax=Pantoea sp. 1.19 TaxID=1925589 RepID=UPI0009490C46|nr:hypothetical protein [Pantoea sp. 1.19]
MKALKPDAEHPSATRRQALSKLLVSAAGLGALSGLAHAGGRAPDALPAPSGPDRFRGQAPGIILDHATTSWAQIRNDRARDGGPVDNFADLQQLMEDKKYLTIDTPLSVSDTLTLSISNQRVEGRGNGILTPLAGMQNKFLLRLTADGTKVQGLMLDNPQRLKSASGGRQGGITLAANYCEVANCTFWRMLQSVIAPADFGAYGTKVVDNWFLECLGAGAGESDPDSRAGEDRGDAVTLWGSGSIITGNHAWCRADQDARIAFHAEGLYGARRSLRDVDHKDIIMMNNMAKGPFRRHFALENITDGVSIGNISMGGATWWGEAYIQCKNVIAQNVIRYSNAPENRNGAAWKPIKAAIAVVNFNHGVNIRSSVLIAEGTRACGFATATQTGEMDVTLSGYLRNEGSRNNTAVFLNNPSDFRLENLRSRGFARALSLRVTGDTRIDSINCRHELNGSHHAVAIAAGRGGTLSLNGDTYRGGKTAFVLPNLDNLSIRNTTVEAHDRFAALSGIRQSLTITNNTVIGEKKLPLAWEGDGGAPEISWLVEGNIGVDNALHYRKTQLSQRQSRLNQMSKFAGKNVTTGGRELWVALGDDPGAPWLNLATRETLTPA